MGETSYMHNLGQCFLGALCGATPARSLLGSECRRISRRGATAQAKFGGMINM